MISIPVLLLAGLALAQSPKKTGPLASTVFDWNSLEVKKTARGERREILNQTTATLGNLESHVTTLEAGLEAHDPHRHPDEEIVIVKEGTLEATVLGKTQIAGPGSMFFFASNDLHGLKNAGSARATYFVIRIVR